VHKPPPNAQVVADRFHVMKLVNQDLDAAEKHYEASQEQTDEEKSN